jgi:hypothetical protein
MVGTSGEHPVVFGVDSFGDVTLGAVRSTSHAPRTPRLYALPICRSRRVQDRARGRRRI